MRSAFIIPLAFGFFASPYESAPNTPLQYDF